VALIPNYATSVRMNAIFRHIKENARLDALEESDDEAEFEDVREDKFVDLDKCEELTFRWHTKFRKYSPWFPLQ